MCQTAELPLLSHLCHMMSSVTEIGLNCQSQWCWRWKCETTWKSMRDDCCSVASNQCALNETVWINSILSVQSCLGTGPTTLLRTKVHIFVFNTVFFLLLLFWFESLTCHTGWLSCCWRSLLSPNFKTWIAVLKRFPSCIVYFRWMTSWNKCIVSECFTSLLSLKVWCNLLQIC